MGTKELSEDKLKEVITLQSQVFLDKKEVKASAEKIRDEYQKKGIITQKSSRLSRHWMSHATGLPFLFKRASVQKFRRSILRV